MWTAIICVSVPLHYTLMVLLSRRMLIRPPLRRVLHVQMYPSAGAVQLRQLALVPTRIHHLPYLPVRVPGVPSSETKEGPLSLDLGVLPDRIVAVD